MNQEARAEPASESSAPPASRQHADFWIVAAAVLLVFGRLCVAEFGLMDDPHTIYDNPWMRAPLVEALGHYWTHAEYGLFVPITHTVWVLLAQVAALQSPDPQGIMLNSWYFHTVNVALHAGSALLVLGLLRRLLRHRLAALAGALLWALHPMQVETVGWTSGMKDLLCWFLVLVALDVWLRRTEQNKPMPRTLLYVGLLMVAAVLSKPTAMVLPGLIWTLDVFLRDRPWLATLRRVGPLLVISLAAAVMTRMVQSAPGVYVPDTVGKLVVAADAVTHYTHKLVWPVGLTFDYGRSPGFVVQQTDARTWAWFVPLVAIVVGLLAMRRAPFVTGGLLFALVAVSPLLGLVPFMFQIYSTVADHYAYLMLLGPAMIVGGLIARTPPSRTRVATAAALVVAALFAWLSFQQAGVWMNALVNNVHGMRVNPTSLMALNNHAVALTNLNRWPEAIDSFRRAAEAHPHVPAVYSNRARTLVRLGPEFYPQVTADLALAYDLLIAQEPRDEVAIVTNRSLLARVLVQMNRHEEAAAVLDAVEADFGPRYQLDLLRQELRLRPTTRPATTPQ